MILNNVFFDGFDITSSRFIDHDNSDTDGGRFNLDYVDLKFFSDQEDETLQYLYIDVTAILKAYNGVSSETNLEENLAFECETSYSLTFKYLAESPMSNQEFEDNIWFFENYLALCGKMAIESVLKHTLIETISLPWHRKMS